MKIRKKIGLVLMLMVVAGVWWVVGWKYGSRRVVGEVLANTPGGITVCNGTGGLSCGAKTCLDSNHVVRPCYQGSVFKCWDVTSDCQNSGNRPDSCLNGACGNLPPPSSIDWCGASLGFSCSTLGCLDTTTLVQTCCKTQTTGTCPDYCRKVKQTCTNCSGSTCSGTPSTVGVNCRTAGGSCKSDCEWSTETRLRFFGVDCSDPAKPVCCAPLSTMPTPIGDNPDNCLDSQVYRNGSGWNSVQASDCNSAGDPNDATKPNGSGVGCANTKTIAHFFCDSISARGVSCDADHGGRLIWQGTGSRTFTNVDCGTEQMDTDCGFASIVRSKDCPLTPTPTRPIITITLTPTPTPTVTRTPTPTPTTINLRCKEALVAPLPLVLNSKVNITCVKDDPGNLNPNAVYEFRYMVNDTGTSVVSALVNGGATSKSITILVPGKYTFDCRVCRAATSEMGKVCTVWGKGELEEITTQPVATKVPEIMFTIDGGAR